MVFSRHSLPLPIPDALALLFSTRPFTPTSSLLLSTPLPLLLFSPFLSISSASVLFKLFFFCYIQCLLLILWLVAIQAYRITLSVEFYTQFPFLGNAIHWCSRLSRPSYVLYHSQKFYLYFAKFHSKNKRFEVLLMKKKIPVLNLFSLPECLMNSVWYLQRRKVFFYDFQGEKMQTWVQILMNEVKVLCVQILTFFTNSTY